MTTIVVAAAAADLLDQLDQVPRMLSSLLGHGPSHAYVVVAGVIDDIEDEDNRRGYEDDEATFLGIVHAAQNDACPVCGLWSCNRVACAGSAVNLVPQRTGTHVVRSNGGQCGICGGWFDDWPGGTCGACKANGY